MDELNSTQSVSTFVEEGFDDLSVIDLGESISIAQVDEDGLQHDVVIGPDQAEALIRLLQGLLG